MNKKEFDNQEQEQEQKQVKWDLNMTNAILIEQINRARKDQEDQGVNSDNTSVILQSVDRLIKINNIDCFKKIRK